MMSRRLATVESVDDSQYFDGKQMLVTNYGPAISFVPFVDRISVGNTVLINCTATDLDLGTGGVDFVIARIDPPPEDSRPANRASGHIMKLRYTPFQMVGRVFEEFSLDKEYWNRKLDAMPVVCCLLHSQIAPVVAALCSETVYSSYVMTDSAALPSRLSNLISQLHKNFTLGPVIATGQAFDHKSFCSTITLHNALLASKYILRKQAAIVCQGPGNTGTATKYGFSGIDQANNLDIAAALGATPVACVRASSNDKRERHQGISHHTVTVLELVRSSVIVALPEGLDAPKEWYEKHDIRIISRERTEHALNLLKKREIDVTTMGRGIDEDQLYFHAAAAAGVVAADIAATQPPSKQKYYEKN